LVNGFEFFFLLLFVGKGEREERREGGREMKNMKMRKAGK
jgi:hypothetical protein